VGYIYIFGFGFQNRVEVIDKMGIYPYLYIVW